MDPQFQELADRIDRMAGDITQAVTESVTQSVTASVTAAINEHVTNVVTAAEKRLSEQAQINAEAVRETARAIADGYGGTLEAIERRLDRFEQTVTNSLTDHDRILEDHQGRITRLERPRR